ncbi:MAG TPA: hypothetical protein PK760_00610, partial [Flavobacteriales bacterium]|nr:hypothetical protein [Flavobacteriales bacterium]
MTDLNSWIVRLRRPVVLVLLLSILSSSLNAQSVQLPTRGKRFWAAFMQNGFGAASLKVHVASTQATSGSVSMPLTGWSVPFNVAANSVTVIDVPLSAEHSGCGTVQNK